MVECPRWVRVVRHAVLSFPVYVACSRAAGLLSADIGVARACTFVDVPHPIDGQQSLVVSFLL